jgi:hypothetical protein
MTWLAIAVLGPGALIIFVAFLRDLARPAAPEHPTDEDAGHSRGGDGGRGCDLPPAW